MHAHPKRWLAAAALAGAGLAAAVATTSVGAATTDTTTATTTGTTTAATTTTATTTATTTTTAPATTVPAPQNTSPPTISGTPGVGDTLTATQGSWSGSGNSYSYQYERCDSQGGACAAISGATSQTYKLGSADVGNTLRVVVTAKNDGGSTSATSVPTAVIAGAPAPPPPTGCSSAKKGTVVGISSVSQPARLLISGFQSNPGTVTFGTSSFSMRVIVSDTCGHPVEGALVYATPVPFGQFSIPAEQATGSDGSVTLTFSRESGFPTTRRQQLLAMFLRARKPGEDVLTGVSTRRLVSIPVHR